MTQLQHRDVARRQQEQMRGRVLQENGISLPCTRVGGFDISFYRGFSPAVAQSSPSASTESAVACLVVVHFPVRARARAEAHEPLRR